MSRIKVRRVAHAVLWGDGLRLFRVRDGRLLYLPSTKLRSRALCAGAPSIARLRGPSCFCSAPLPGARQQIRTCRWRVTPGAWVVGDGRTYVYTRTHTHRHKSPPAKPVLGDHVPRVWSELGRVRLEVQASKSAGPRNDDEDDGLSRIADIGNEHRCRSVKGTRRGPRPDKTTIDLEDFPRGGMRSFE